jgi:predicted transcriptional regulator
VFDSVEGSTITTSDVADILDCSREVARYRLNDLVKCSLIKRRKSGRVVFWWRADPDEDTENPYLQGFGALVDTDLPEEMKQERKRAEQSWAQHGDGQSS